MQTIKASQKRRNSNQLTVRRNHYHYYCCFGAEILFLIISIILAGYSVTENRGRAEFIFVSGNLKVEFLLSWRSLYGRPQRQCFPWKVIFAYSKCVKKPIFIYLVSVCTIGAYCRCFRLVHTSVCSLSCLSDSPQLIAAG